MRSISLSGCLVCGALLVACSGVIEDGHVGGSSGPEGWDPVAGAPLDPEALPEFAPVAGSMLRLTEGQYRGIVRRVFGEGVEMTVALEEDPSSAEFTTHAASTVATSARGVEQYRDAAMEIAAQVVAAGSGVSVRAGCEPTMLNAPCVRTVVERVGEQLFRRSLEAEEIDSYAGMVGSVGFEPDVLELSWQYAIAAMLQAPSFLYVPSEGVSSGEDEHPRLAGFDLASRLALFLWNEGPDAELFEVAKLGGLDDPAELESQVRRMLADERAKDLGSRFFSQHWQVAQLDETDKRTDRFPLWSAELLADFRTELDMVLTELTFERSGDLLDVFDGRTTFVNGRLAELYGMDVASDDWVQAPLGEHRSGLLTSGAVIAANSPADLSTPTKRGVFILTRLLCADVPEPSEEQLADAQEELQMLQPGDERAFIERRLARDECGSCHRTIDPLGNVFDEFNSIGRHRSGEDQIGALGLEPYDSVSELGAFLREDPQASRCITEKFYSFATGHPVEPGEEIVVYEINQAFQESGNSFQELVTATLVSDGYRFMAAE